MAAFDDTRLVSLRTLYALQYLHNQPIAVDYAGGSRGSVKTAKQGLYIV